MSVWHVVSPAEPAFHATVVAASVDEATELVRATDAPWDALVMDAETWAVVVRLDAMSAGAHVAVESEDGFTVTRDVFTKRADGGWDIVGDCGGPISRTELAFMLASDTVGEVAR